MQFSRFDLYRILRPHSSCLILFANECFLADTIVALHSAPELTESLLFYAFQYISIPPPGLPHYLFSQLHHLLSYLFPCVVSYRIIHGILVIYCYLHVVSHFNLQRPKLLYSTPPEWYTSHSSPCWFFPGSTCIVVAVHMRELLMNTETTAASANYIPSISKTSFVRLYICQKSCYGS